MEFKLIIKKLNNTLSSEESLIFEAWYAESELHQEYFSRLRERYNQAPESVDLEKGWAVISAQIAPKPTAEEKPSISSKYWKYVAAAAAIVILAGLPFMQDKEVRQKPDTTPVLVEKEPIHIGTNKATLTLANGSQVILEKGESFKAKNVSSNGEQLVYSKSQTANQISAITHNTLSIPRGGQFFITLADGTEVWLNSDSELRYPTAFTDNAPRTVELIYGEAYFDVSPSTENNGTQFKVRTKGQEIDVLGTEFNIKAYKEDQTIATTLVEGKVNLRNNTTSINLLPGQQSQLNLKTDLMVVETVDVYNEISWKNGFFSFKNKPLKEIMLVLARWYDVEVQLEDPNVGAIEFNGVFNKEQDLQNILTIIENTNEVEFKTKGKTISVK